MPDHPDPRIPPAEACPLRTILDRHAGEIPEAVFVRFEDEVMVVVAPKPGRTVDPSALIEVLRPRMADFMLPRYVRVVAALPKTPTAKVQEAELRAEGITPDTWDRSSG